MRDDMNLPAQPEPISRPDAGLGTNIIQFPARMPYRPDTRYGSSKPDAWDAVATLITTVADGHDARAPLHRPSTLAAMGALAGFAAQQTLLLGGGSGWLQPNRATHLDRLLLSDNPTDASLWHGLRDTAHALGVRHLPDPGKLLAATLRCVGTTQLGVITLPLAHRLNEQPQTSLTRHWARVRTGFDLAGLKPPAWPPLTAAACVRRVIMDQRQVPPHVAVRIVLQSAIAMALIEPRLIPGAAVKPDAS